MNCCSQANRVVWCQTWAQAGEFHPLATINKLNSLLNYSRVEMEANQSIPNPDKREDYKLMIKNIAENITNPDDLSKLTYMCDISNTGSERDTPVLDIFRKLERKGKFAHDNVRPLEDLLTNIDRYDLVTKHIEPYKQKYGRFAGEY